MSASVIGQGAHMSRYSMESMDSRFRGNDDNCADDVIPAKAGIYRALTEHGWR